MGRIIELVRAIADRFKNFLLDEPPSSLDPAETHELGCVRGLVDEHGDGGRIVEHDMPLVMLICEHIYAIDFENVFEATSRDVQVVPGGLRR